MAVLEENITLIEQIKNEANVYGEELYKMLDENVYKTIIYGVPFQLADEFAYQTKEYNYNDPRRLIGAVTSAYLDKIKQGHTYWHRLSEKTEKLENGHKVLLNSFGLQEQVTKLLIQSRHLFPNQTKMFEWFEGKDGQMKPRLDSNLFYATLEKVNDLKFNNKPVFEYNEYEGKKRIIHLPSYWSEYQIAKRIIELMKEEVLLQTSPDVIRFKAEALGADAAQAKAISEVFSNKVSLITGGPGTGKSYTIETLVSLILEENMEYKIRIVAPTGIAAQNLQLRLSQSEDERVQKYFENDNNKCRTIHRLLEMKPSESIGTCRTKYSYHKEPLECDVLIIEEMSMSDIYLTRTLLRAIPNHAHVVLVGDPDQLASVGAGNVLYDLTYGLEKLQQKEHLSILPKWTVLNTVHRTEKSSRIPLLARTLLISNPDHRWEFFKKELERCIKNGDVIYTEERDSTKLLQNTVNCYLELYKNESIALITPRHESNVGRNELNNQIQSKLFGHTELEKGVLILQNRNDYRNGVFNGEKGIIVSVNKDEVTADFGEDRIVTLSLKQANDDWLIGYATSVHKSQGTESNTVILPIWSEPKKKIWNRTLLYTALTRSKKVIHLIGSEEALEKAVKYKNGKRITRLPLFYRSISRSISKK